MVQVAVDAADAEVVEEHPLAGQRGQHVDDLVALDERPQDRRQAAEVERHPAQEQGVAGDPVELGREDPDVLGPARHLDVHQLLEGQDRRPLVEQRADVLERVGVADRLVVVGVLAQLLDAAVEVAEDRVEVDDLLAVELEDDPQDAVGRRVLGAHVDEHLAVAERVELGLALGPRRVRRDRLEDAQVAVEHDARVVGRTGVGGGRHRGRSGSGQAGVRRTSAVVGALRGACARSIGRTPPPGERAASSGRKKSLRSGKLCVVGRHVDPAQVAVALERDPEHVVGLALHPLGALPQERDRRDARIVARQAVGDDAQPVRRRLAPQVVDDLHDLAGVHARRGRSGTGSRTPGSSWSAVRTGDDVAGPDPDLGLVVALADGPGQLRRRSGPRGAP